MDMKTVTVAFQLRVPTGMRVGDIKQFVAIAVGSEPGCRDPESYEAGVKLYKDRVEVFAP